MVKNVKHTPSVSPSEWKAYLELCAAWKTNPILYAKQRFGLILTPQQERIVRALVPEGAKVTVRSGHGIGKSSSAAVSIFWFMETRPYAKVPCTAPTAHQLRDILWAELFRWQRAADEQSLSRGDPERLWLSSLFHLTQDRLYDLSAPEWAAVARTASKENPESLQGFHGDNLLFVIDEAAGIPEPIFETAHGALTNDSARVLMLGNPTRLIGTFAASHRSHRAEYTALHFRSQDSPLVGADYRPSLVRKWGEDSNMVRVRADGEFPTGEDDVLIPLTLTEAALARNMEPDDAPKMLGVDVARYGNNRTVLLFRQGSAVLRIKVFRKMGTMSIVGEVLAVVDIWNIDAICVDVIGVGAGVFDRLREIKGEQQVHWDVYAVNVAERALPEATVDGVKPRRMGDALWLAMKQWLTENECSFLEPDRMLCEDLAGEISTRRYSFNSEGLLMMEEKDIMSRRLGHSPDLADALADTFVPIDAVERTEDVSFIAVDDLGQRVSPWQEPGHIPRGYDEDEEEEINPQRSFAFEHSLARRRERI